MPGVSSVLVILCACLSLIEATTMHHFNFSIAICGLSKVSDFHVLACFKKAAWMSDAWGFQRLGDIMRLSFLSLKRLPFEHFHLSSSMKLHIQFASRKVRERQMPGVSSVFMTLCEFPLCHRTGRQYDVSHTATRFLSESDISYFQVEIWPKHVWETLYSSVSSDSSSVKIF